MRLRNLMRLPNRLSIFLATGFLIAACNTGAKSSPPAPGPAPTPAPPAPASTAEGVLRLGAPIEASANKVALSDIAKSPNTYVDKTFATTGTVTAVCQHMGCWMEIKDDASAAHIKMAGHAFFVPKTASGRKARVLAKLEKAENDPACAEESHEGMSASAQPGAKAKGKGCRPKPRRNSVVRSQSWSSSPKASS